MRCTDASAVMTQLLDGLTSPEQEAALLCHTAECAACRSEWRAIQEVHTLLSAAPMVPPPTGFTHRVMARLTAAQSRTEVILPPRSKDNPAVASARLTAEPVLLAASSASQVLDDRPSRANPWGGILALLFGAVLTLTLILLPVLLRVLPDLWTALTTSAGLDRSLTGTLQFVGGLVGPILVIWRAYWTLLHSVSPVLLLAYAAMTLTAMLFWLRLVTGIQRVLHVRK